MKIIFIIILLVSSWISASDEEKKMENDIQESDTTQQMYKFDKPGTITFTVGAKIKGKVEKPQVMIFLPKEKIHYKQVVLERTFKEDLNEPLPFIPMVK